MGLSLNWPIKSCSSSRPKLLIALVDYFYHYLVY